MFENLSKITKDVGKNKQKATCHIISSTKIPQIDGNILAAGEKVNLAEYTPLPLVHEKKLKYLYLSLFMKRHF